MSAMGDRIIEAGVAVPGGVVANHIGINPTAAEFNGLRDELIALRELRERVGLLILDWDENGVPGGNSIVLQRLEGLLS